MMMDAVIEKLDAAFDLGTHANRQDFITVTRNQEAVCFEAFGTKRFLGSFPGSVRVSNIFVFFLCVCVCVCVSKSGKLFFCQKKRWKRRSCSTASFLPPASALHSRLPCLQALL